MDTDALPNTVVKSPSLNTFKRLLDRVDLCLFAVFAVLPDFLFYCIICILSVFVFILRAHVSGRVALYAM